MIVVVRPRNHANPELRICRRVSKHEIRSAIKIITARKIIDRPTITRAALVWAASIQTPFLPASNGQNLASRVLSHHDIGNVTVRTVRDRIRDLIPVNVVAKTVVRARVNDQLLDAGVLDVNPASILAIGRIDTQLSGA